MKILSRAALRGWTAALVGLVLVGLVTVFGAGSAVADPAPRSLHYMCPFPLIGDQPMRASVVWNASDTHVVGRATPRVSSNNVATVGADVTRSLRFVGATTVEGTADVHAVVAAPEGDIPLTVTLKVAKTAVPESGPLAVPAGGTTPSLVFHRPGPAKIVVGAIDLHLTPRNANGGQTLAGEVDTSCRLNNGQNGTLSTFEVVPAAPRPTASGAPVPPGEPGKAGPPGAPGTSGGPGAADSGASGSASASASATVRGPSGSPSGTASASRSGAPGTAAPDASATSGTDVPAPLRAVAAILVASAASAGIGWWGWRRRRAEGRDE